MRVVLGKFAKSSLESRLGGDLDHGVRTAVVHYVQRLMSPYRPLGLPTMSVGRHKTEPGATVDLVLDARMEKLVRAEACRLAVPVEQVLSHAVLVYLADLDGALLEDPVALV